MTQDTRVLLGVIGKPYGVRGLLHVHSYTEDPDALAAYCPLQDDTGVVWHLRWRGAGIAQFSTADKVPIADRTGAEKLVNRKLYIERSRLPQPDDDEFYVNDLIGLTARDASDQPIGRVTQAHDYGAGLSLEIERQNGPALLLPFTKACVPDVNIQAGWLRVCPPDMLEARAEEAGKEA